MKNDIFCKFSMSNTIISRNEQKNTGNRIYMHIHTHALNTIT